MDWDSSKKWLLGLGVVGVGVVLFLYFKQPEESSVKRNQGAGRMITFHANSDNRPEDTGTEKRPDYTGKTDLQIIDNSSTKKETNTELEKRVGNINYQFGNPVVIEENNITNITKQGDTILSLGGSEDDKPEQGEPFNMQRRSLGNYNSGAGDLGNDMDLCRAVINNAIIKPASERESFIRNAFDGISKFRSLTPATQKEIVERILRDIEEKKFDNTHTHCKMMTNGDGNDDKKGNNNMDKCLAALKIIIEGNIKSEDGIKSILLNKFSDFSNFSNAKKNNMVNDIIKGWDKTSLTAEAICEKHAVGGDSNDPDNEDDKRGHPDWNSGITSEREICTILTANVLSSVNTVKRIKARTKVSSINHEDFQKQIASAHEYDHFEDTSKENEVNRQASSIGKIAEERDEDKYLAPNQSGGDAVRDIKGFAKSTLAGKDSEEQRSNFVNHEGAIMRELSDNYKRSIQEVIDTIKNAPTASTELNEGANVKNKNFYKALEKNLKAICNQGAGKQKAVTTTTELDGLIKNAINELNEAYTKDVPNKSDNIAVGKIASDLRMSKVSNRCKGGAISEVGTRWVWSQTHDILFKNSNIVHTIFGELSNDDLDAFITRLFLERKFIWKMNTLQEAGVLEYVIQTGRCSGIGIDNWRKISHKMQNIIEGKRKPAVTLKDNEQGSTQEFMKSEIYTQIQESFDKIFQGQPDYLSVINALYKMDDFDNVPGYMRSDITKDFLKMKRAGCDEKCKQAGYFKLAKAINEARLNITSENIPELVRQVPESFFVLQSGEKEKVKQSFESIFKDKNANESDVEQKFKSYNDDIKNKAKETFSKMKGLECDKNCRDENYAKLASDIVDSGNTITCNNSTFAKLDKTNQKYIARVAVDLFEKFLASAKAIRLSIVNKIWQETESSGQAVTPQRCVQIIREEWSGYNQNKLNISGAGDLDEEIRHINELSRQFSDLITRPSDRCKCFINQMLNKLRDKKIDNFNSCRNVKNPAEDQFFIFLNIRLEQYIAAFKERNVKSDSVCVDAFENMQKIIKDNKEAEKFFSNTTISAESKIALVQICVEKLRSIYAILESMQDKYFAEDEKDKYDGVEYCMIIDE